jgi:transcriptional regulator with XRE-family HTH domain
MKEVRSYLGLSLRDFGKRVDIPDATISRYETGGRNPSQKMIFKYINNLKVSKEWIMFGEGDMFKNEDIRSNKAFYNQNIKASNGGGAVGGENNEFIRNGSVTNHLHLTEKDEQTLKLGGEIFREEELANVFRKNAQGTLTLDEVLKILHEAFSIKHNARNLGLTI